MIEPSAEFANDSSPVVEAARAAQTATEKLYAASRRQSGNDDAPNPTGQQGRLYSDHKLSSSGNTVTISPCDGNDIRIYSVDGWVPKPFLAAVTLDTTGYTTDKKYDLFFTYDDASETWIPSAAAWTSETVQAVTLDTVDGIQLLSTDYSYRYLGWGRYNGSTMLISGNNALGMTYYGTGNPEDPTGADPFTGEILNADGLFGYSNGVLKSSISAQGLLTAVGATISGTISAGGLNLNGPLTMSSASGSIAIGTTPPTSATVGTGLWIDRTGVYALLASVQQATLTSAGLSAAAGDVKINVDGISVLAGTSYASRNSLKFLDGSANILSEYYIANTTLVIESRLRMNGVAGKSSYYYLQGLAPTTKQSRVYIEAQSGSAFSRIYTACLDSPASSQIELTADTTSVSGTLSVTGSLSTAGFLNIGSGVAATIASGVITATSSFMIVDTQAAAATDDLDTINGGSDGDILILQSTANARDVVCKDLTGNMNLAGDYTLSTIISKLTLLRKGGVWQELSRAS